VNTSDNIVIFFDQYKFRKCRIGVTLSRDEILFLLRIKDQMELVRCTNSGVLNSFWNFQYMYFIKMKRNIFGFVPSLLVNLIRLKAVV